MSKNLNKFNLNGKCALITGGAGLLGIEHADALLEVGAKVVLTDINLESLNEAKLNLSKKYSSSFIDVMMMDVTNIDSMRKVSNQITISG
jgi:NADP-dependent 3-hydroxy acid dehydrogenase YdfG